MSIIYSYPIKSTPANDDLILISDSGSNPKFQTKQIKVSSLPGGSASGVSSFNTLTGAVTITAGNNVTFTPSGQNIEISAAGGGNPPGGNANNQIQYKTDTTFGASANLTFTTNTLAVTHTVDIKGDGTNAGKLKLYCESTTQPHAITIEGPAHSGAAAYILKLPSPAPSNQQILQSDGSGNLSWINTPSSGGGGSVDSVNTTDGTYINLTPNSATTGAVTVTADLSAADGTSDTTTRFLSKDNTWDVPSYTTNTDTTYSAGTGLSLASTTFSLASGAALTNLGGGSGTTFLRKDGTWQTVASGTNTNIGTNDLTLAINRTLNFYSDSTDRTLTFINTNGGSKNLFKFDQIGGTTPRFTVGHTESAYEGYIVLEGNGTNRTGQLKFENAAGSYFTAFKATTSQSADITYTLPATIGTQNQVLEISSVSGGNATLGWAAAGSGGVSSIIAGTNVTISSTGSGGTGDVTINASGSGSSASLGFTPCSIYSAQDESVSNYTYYMAAVCDVDLTIAKCKVAVIGATGSIYMAIYSMTTGSLQNSTLARLGTFTKTSGVTAGINELTVDGTITLTAGQNICIGVSSACKLAAAKQNITDINLGLMLNSATTSFPSVPDFEGTAGGTRKPAIHFYAS